LFNETLGFMQLKEVGVPGAAGAAAAGHVEEVNRGSTGPAVVGLSTDMVTM